MFYRRKLILGTLEYFQQPLNDVNLHEILFLVSQGQSSAVFDFIPGGQGCYSFQLAHDLVRLENAGYILRVGQGDSTRWGLKKNESQYFTQLATPDAKILAEVKSLVGNLKEEHIWSIYRSYPYYALNSPQLRQEFEKEHEKKSQQLRHNDETMLYTIGYQGISLESYLNQLINCQVQLLADVRNNPNSRKFGFSKKMLQRACSAVGIEYVHIPELGIEQQERREITSTDQYLELFDHYEKRLLSTDPLALHTLKELITKFRRVAVTCFEMDPSLCHRSRITKVLQEDPDWKIPVKNL